MVERTWTAQPAAHLLRRVGAAIAGGAVTGFVIGGGGARLAMRAIAVSERANFGLTTGSGATVGRVTAGGTIVGVMVVGAFLGALSGIAYLILRPSLPSTRGARALTFALLVALAATGVAIEGNKGDFVVLPKTLSVALFAVVFFLTGLVGALLIDRLAPPPERRRVRRDHVVVALCVAAALALDAKALADLVSL